MSESELAWCVVLSAGALALQTLWVLAIAMGG